MSFWASTSGEAIFDRLRHGTGGIVRADGGGFRGNEAGGGLSFPRGGRPNGGLRPGVVARADFDVEADQPAGSGQDPDPGWQAHPELIGQGIASTAAQGRSGHAAERGDLPHQLDRLALSRGGNPRRSGLAGEAAGTPVARLPRLHRVQLQLLSLRRLGFRAPARGAGSAGKVLRG